MQPATGPQSLRILVATKDRALIRRLSQFLDMMRYEVLQAADPGAAIVALEAERPSMVLLGEDIASANDWALCRQLTEHSLGAMAFKFLVATEPEQTYLNEALEAGIDDFLIEPVGYGELLTRLRAAARVIEHDRRALQQHRVDEQTGLLNRPALIAWLDQWLSSPAGTGQSVACVVLDIDYLQRVETACGAEASATIVNAVARELSSLCTDAEILGRLGPGRFGVLLPGLDGTAAARWAERARELLAVANFQAGGSDWQLTASIGVADDQSAKSASQLVHLASQAVQVARISGRNCVVRHGEFAADHDELTNPRKLFERTVARDVMTPCTVFLRPGEPIGQAIELCHQTRLEALAVVDADGSLVGLCEQAQLALVPETEYASRLVSDVMTREAQQVEEDATFASLMELFTRDSQASLVVVHDRRPIGVVTCNSLLVLPQPLTTESLAAEGEYRDTSEYLLVPDLRPVAGAEQV